MTRARVPKGQIFLKKEEKVLATLEKPATTHSESEFVVKFKELHPDDYRKIVARYEAHERVTLKKRLIRCYHQKSIC